MPQKTEEVNVQDLMFELNVAELQLDFVLRPHTAIYKSLKYIKEKSCVLDVGCAWGYLAKLLKPKQCNVVGIEMDSKVAKIAENYCNQVIVANLEDIETLQLLLKNLSFDVIVCLDILEHLVRPDKFLVFLRKFLTPSGRLIVSIPNVARFEHRINLFFGKFNYENAGILCKGHLRFFTESTAKNLLSGTGYKIIKTEYTGLASMIKIFPKLTAYQFLFVATL